MLVCVSELGRRMCVEGASREMREKISSATDVPCDGIFIVAHVNK